MFLFNANTNDWLDVKLIVCQFQFGYRDMLYNRGQFFKVIDSRKRNSGGSSGGGGSGSGSGGSSGSDDNNDNYY